jgi:hypothetical protein
MRELTTDLETNAAQLTEQVLRDTYQDPFWDARCGAEGRKFAREDGLQHVAQLVQALSANDRGLFTNYARLFQTLSNGRGVCTVHVVDNFERLSRAIAERIPDSESAQAVLRSGIEALVYSEGPAAELAARSASLAESLSSEGEADLSKAFRDREARKMLSYLCDAIATSQVDRFVEHMAWLAQHAKQQDLSVDYFTVLLAALVDAVECDGRSSPELRTLLARLRAAADGGGSESRAR